MYFFVQILLRILLSVVRNTFRNSPGSIKIIKAYDIIQNWTQYYLFLNYSLPRIRQFLENSLSYHFLVDDDAVITNLAICLPALPPLSIVNSKSTCRKLGWVARIRIRSHLLSLRLCPRYLAGDPEGTALDLCSIVDLALPLIASGKARILRTADCSPGTKPLPGSLKPRSPELFATPSSCVNLSSILDPSDYRVRWYSAKHLISPGTG